MPNVTALLTERLKKSDHSSKMRALAEQSASGHLTSFSGIFSVAELSQGEKELLHAILREHMRGHKEIDKDLEALGFLTAEVKAISNQAALLHGERIKKAQELLKKYREGAFTAWLLAAYGNRQTPYNFLQYYEFYEALPKVLKDKVHEMPRQAIYTLASRDGSLAKKQILIENYKGETKTHLLNLIRDLFPLESGDKRAVNVGAQAIGSLKKVCMLLSKKGNRLTKSKNRFS